MEEDSITFLGTAGDVTAINKQQKASGGFIIRYKGSQIHIDPGPGTLCQYKNFKLNPRNTISLIVTNYDMGHCADTNPMVSAMTHDGLDTRGVLIGAKSIIEGSEHENAILWKRYKSYLEKNIVLKQGERVGINEFDIHAIPSRSDDATGFGLKIYTPDFTVGYTSDTKFMPMMMRNLEDVDILIIKTVFPEDEENATRMTTLDATRMINECIPRLAILTGFGSKMISSDPLFIARRIHRETGVYVIGAQDGLSINPRDYTRRY
ncbi:MAG: MBL fold metallo-hydrolase [Candidatus Woesearchaeota archaeon]